MKNQARINRKNKEKEYPNQNQQQQQQQQPIIQEQKPQFINMKYPPNTEQSLQREKQSSESMSYVEKSSIKSKKTKSRKPKDKTKSEQINEIK